MLTEREEVVPMEIIAVLTVVLAAAGFTVTLLDYIERKHKK